MCKAVDPTELFRSYREEDMTLVEAREALLREGWDGHSPRELGRQGQPAPLGLPQPA